MMFICLCLTRTNSFVAVVLETFQLFAPQGNRPSFEVAKTKTLGLPKNEHKLTAE